MRAACAHVTTLDSNFGFKPSVELWNFRLPCFAARAYKTDRSEKRMKENTSELRVGMIRQRGMDAERRINQRVLWQS